MKGKRYKIFMGLLLGIAIIYGSSHASEADNDMVPSRKTIDKIAVLPFIKGRYGSMAEESINISVSKLFYSKDKMPGDEYKIITGYVHSLMFKRYRDNLVSLQEATEVFNKLKENQEITLRALSQDAGKALNTPYVIIGNIWKFKDRIGNAMAVESTASVAFNVFLIEVSTGRVVWRSLFDKTQQSLSGNLLGAPDFFKAGGKWLTSRELARLGVQKAFSTYPF